MAAMRSSAITVRLVIYCRRCNVNHKFWFYANPEVTVYSTDIRLHTCIFFIKRQKKAQILEISNTNRFIPHPYG